MHISHTDLFLPVHFVGANTLYRKAILKAIESLNDFQSRSSIDAVRRHTQDILEDQSWNETLFLLTLKSIVKSGEIDLFPHVSAELSPDYKRKRADSLLRRVEERMKHSPLIPVKPAPLIITNDPPKDAPKGRRKEHEKWKIIPKSEYDRSQ